MAHIAVINKFQSRFFKAYSGKEHTVFVTFVFGLIGLFPGLVTMIMSHSVTILSDLLKNATLVFAAFLSWMAIRRAVSGKNANYNYGFGKLENLSSLVVAALMVVSMAIVLYQTIGRFGDPQPIQNVGAELGALFSGLAALINAYMWRHDRILSKKQPSPVLESMWRLNRVKTVSALCVCISLTLSLTLKAHSWAIYIDPVGSMVILGFLGFSAYGVVSMSVYDLLDRTLDESLQLVILRELASDFDKYVAIHGIRSRRSGSRVFIEIFLEFEADKRMNEVQIDIENMRTSLEKKIPGSRVVIAPAIAPVN